MKLLQFLFFNQLIKPVIDIDYGARGKKPPTRVKAMLFEILYLFMVFTPFILFTIILARGIELLLPVDVASAGFHMLNLIVFLPMSFFGVLAMNKDFFNGRSIANRVCGYQVIDEKTLKPPNPFKCMLRNITLLIFPIELPFVLFNPERRLGDYIAGTKLIKVKPGDPESILLEFTNHDFEFNSKLALGIPALLFMVWTVWSLVG